MVGTRHKELSHKRHVEDSKCIRIRLSLHLHIADPARRWSRSSAFFGVSRVTCGCGGSSRIMPYPVG